MAVGFPTKANWAAGDVLTASAMDDLAGTVNLLSNASAATGSILVSNAAGTSFVYQGSQAAGKNAIINGGFDIWQRGTTTTSSGYQTADRWACANLGGGTTTFSRESTIVSTGSTYSMKFAQATANGLPFADQVIETLNSVQFAGKTIAVSIQAAASASTTATIELNYSTSTDNPENGSWTAITPTSGGSGTVTTTASFAAVTGIYAVPSTAKTLKLRIYTNPLTTGTSFYFGQVQLELGSVATAFTRAGGNIQGELSACQRYYYRIAGQSYAVLLANTFARSTGNMYGTMKHPVTMRTQPAFGSSNVNSTDFNIQYAGSDVTVATLGSLFPNTTSVGLATGGSGFTVGQGGLVYIAAGATSAWVDVSAEL